MNFRPSPEQEAIIDAVRGARLHSVMVEAGAGCAKTSTLTRCSEVVKVPGLAIAFNKKIQLELERRLASNFTCKTMNGLGHVAWARAIGVKSNGLKVDGYKAGKLISEMAKSRKIFLTTDQWDFAKLLFREAQIQGLVPEPFGSQLRTLLPDTEEGWRELADVHAIPDWDFELLWEIVRMALLEDIRQAYKGIVSYDDQIYCSVMLDGVFAKYSYIFVDEDQDLSPLQIIMIQKSLMPDGRILAVGDKCQSIYAFRGAVGEAAEQIRLLRKEWVDLPLMTSFRCPQLVADRQREHVPLFRAHGTNAVGQILRLGSGGEEQGWHWKGFADQLPEYNMPAAILCRNNAPLMSMAFKLLRGGIGCHVLGRDLSKGLKALTKKLAPDDRMTIDLVMGRITDWRDSELSKARINDNPDAADKYADKADSVLAIAESSGAKDAGTLRQVIDKLFAAESGVVTLSTIHKAKGLEWGAVIHLDPYRIPSTYAVKSGGRALEQEANLKYVAETRTKHTLALARLDGFVA